MSYREQNAAIVAELEQIEPRFRAMQSAIREMRYAPDRASVIADLRRMRQDIRPLRRRVRELWQQRREMDEQQRIDMKKVLDQPKKVKPRKPSKPLPGSELRRITNALKIPELPGCSCKKVAAEMDKKGCDWCRQNVGYIVGKMRENYKLMSWDQVLAAATNAIASGIAVKVNPLNPFESLVLLAIERAEAA